MKQKLQRHCLYLACRHHISELLIGAAFEKIIGISSGLEVQLFKRFKEQWALIDKERYHPGPTDDYVMNVTADVRDKIA